MSSQGNANTKVMHAHNLCQSSILEGKEASGIVAGCTELVLNKEWATGWSLAWAISTLSMRSEVESQRAQGDW